MNDICYLCGQEGADTKENIPPRCFFPQGERDKIIKVPAHFKCNQEWGDAIEYFRNQLVGISAMTNPTAHSILTTKGTRSLRRNQPLLRKIIGDLRRKIDICTPGGIYLRTQPGIKIDSGLLKKFVIHMVRGLYYYHKGSVLPEGTNITWKIQPSGVAPEWISRLPIIEVHQDVFKYRYKIIDDHPEWSTWVLGFYEVSLGTILVITGNEQK